MACDARLDDWLTLEAIIETARTEMNDQFHGIPYLLIGDMNARHPLWDPWCQHPNTGGNRINSILLTQHDWHLLNNHLQTPTPTHYAKAPPYSTSIIDLALTNNINLFRKFEIDNANILLSDHRAICVSLTCRSHPLSIPLKHIWRTHDPNVPWDMFQAELIITLQPWRLQWEQLLSHHISVTQSDIDACWFHLRTIIINAATAIIGKKVIRFTSHHWFTINPNIPQLHRKYIRLRRAYDRHRIQHHIIPPHLLLRLRQARKEFDHAMRNAKQKCWEELIQQIDKDHHIMWTAWHRTTPSTFTSLPTFQSSPNIPPVTSPTENLNIMARHFESVSTLPDDPQFDRSMDNTVHQTMQNMQLPQQQVSLPFNMDDMKNGM